MSTCTFFGHRNVKTDIEAILQSTIIDLIENTLLPEGIENVPPRFAISWRNKWMLERSDYFRLFK